MKSASRIQNTGLYAERRGEASGLPAAGAWLVQPGRGVVNRVKGERSACFGGVSTYNFTNPRQKAANKQGAWLDRAWPPG